MALRKKTKKKRNSNNQNDIYTLVQSSTLKNGDNGQSDLQSNQEKPDDSNSQVKTKRPRRKRQIAKNTDQKNTTPVQKNNRHSKKGNPEEINAPKSEKIFSVNKARASSLRKNTAINLKKKHTDEDYTLFNAVSDTASPSMSEESLYVDETDVNPVEGVEKTAIAIKRGIDITDKTVTIVSGTAIGATALVRGTSNILPSFDKSADNNSLDSDVSKASNNDTLNNRKASNFFRVKHMLNNVRQALNSSNGVLLAQHLHKQNLRLKRKKEIIQPSSQSLEHNAKFIGAKVAFGIPNGLIRATNSTLNNSGSIISAGLSDDAKTAYAPIASTLVASQSVLLSPKKVPKTVASELGSSFKGYLPSELKETYAPTSSLIGSISTVSKATVKSAKTAKTTVKLAKRTAKGIAIAAKLVAKLANMIKMVKIAIVAGKIFATVGKAIASVVIKVLKAIGLAIVGVLGVKAVIIATVVAGLVMIIILTIWIFSSNVPNAESEELLSHARLIRELDADINAQISQVEALADEVNFVVDLTRPYPDVRLRTNIIYHFALFMTMFDQDWITSASRNVEDNIKVLWQQMHHLNITWYEREVEVEIALYCEYGYPKLDEYGYPIIEIQLITQNIAYIHLIVFTLEEMFDILDFTENQIRDVHETIHFGLIWELHPELRPYLLESDRGLPPQEVAYVLQDIPISWPTHHRHISSPFGWRTIQGVPNFHHGIDLPMAIGTETFASMDGTVITSSFVGSAGHMIAIQSDCGRVLTRYLHLSQRLVSVNARVERGHLIALSGNSGAETTSRGHLHYDIAIDGVRINPLYALP